MPFAISRRYSSASVYLPYSQCPSAKTSEKSRVAISPGPACGPGEHLQLRIRGDVGLVHPGQSGMRLQRDLIEAVREEAVLILQELREHAEQLLVEIHLVHAVALVERRHGAPAHVHRGEHMRGGPIEHALELIPIIDVLEPQMLDGAPVTIRPS